jgi:flagellar FliL protein
MNEDTTGAADAAPAKPGKLPLIVAAVVSLAIGAGVGTVVLGPRVAPGPASAEHGEDSAKAVKEPGAEHEEGLAAPMYAIENIVLNPAGTNGSRYLLLTVALVLGDASGEATARARDIEVRDRIVALLATQTVEDLVDPAQRDSLKARIQQSITPLFPAGTVRRVLLPQFVVQ